MLSFLWMRATWQVLSWRNYVDVWPPSASPLSNNLLTNELLTRGNTEAGKLWNSPKQLMTPCHDFKSFLRSRARFKHSASPQTHENSYCVSTRSVSKALGCVWIPALRNWSRSFRKKKKKWGGEAHNQSQLSHANCRTPDLSRTLTPTCLHFGFSFKWILGVSRNEVQASKSAPNSLFQ